MSEPEAKPAAADTGAYDVIVIGAGVAGLGVATTLAGQHKKRVLLLDKETGSHVGDYGGPIDNGSCFCQL